MAVTAVECIDVVAQLRLQKGLGIGPVYHDDAEVAEVGKHRPAEGHLLLLPGVAVMQGNVATGGIIEFSTAVGFEW